MGCKSEAFLEVRFGSAIYRGSLLWRVPFCDKLCRSAFQSQTTPDMIIIFNIKHHFRFKKNILKDVEPEFTITHTLVGARDNDINYVGVYVTNNDAVGY